MSIDLNEPIVLVTTASDVEAELIAEALREVSIEAEVTDAASATFRVASPGGIHVLVKRLDIDQAQLVLERIKQESAAIDWSKVDIGEPEPGE